MVEQHLLESKFSFSWQRLGGWDRDILSCFHWQDAESEKRKQSPPAARRGPGSQRRFFKRAPLSNTFSAGCHPLEHLLISDSDLNDLNMSHRISHNAPSKTNSCVKVLRVKAMLTDRSRLSHAGSFLGFPPLWSSAPPPVQAHTSSPAVGGVLEHALTCCTAWLNRQREREREAATGGEARGWWSTVFQCKVTHTSGEPVNRLLLMPTRWVHPLEITLDGRPRLLPG